LGDKIGIAVVIGVESARLVFIISTVSGLTSTSISC